MRVTFEVAFQALPPSLHRHCTDEAQKAETVLSAVIYIYIYNPPNNFCQLSLDKIGYVIQNRAMVIRRYPPSDLISSSDFILTEGKPKNKQTFKLNFQLGKENQKRLFTEVSEG